MGMGLPDGNGGFRDSLALRARYFFKSPAVLKELADVLGTEVGDLVGFRQKGKVVCFSEKTNRRGERYLLTNILFHKHSCFEK